MDYTGKTVLITGASAGIGKETARQFAKCGANLVLVARRKDRLEQLKVELQRHGTKTIACPCDVSDKAQVITMSEKVLSEFKSVDVLVNNAGFAIYGTVSDLSIDDIESQMKTNYLGMVYCTKQFLPAMQAQGSGHIVNVASVAASFGLPGIASYCASKFAMLGFSEGLNHELKGTGIRVTVVSPIMVRTEFFDHPSFANLPRYSPTSLDPKTVAKAILRAANSSRLEIIVPAPVRLAVWLKHTIPYIISPILGRSFQRQLDAAKNP